MKLNILKSFRVQLAGYAIISCILTFLSDISVIAFIQLVKWNLARITLKKSLIGTPEDIFTIMRQTEPGIWWLLAIITVFCFFVYYIVMTAPMVNYFREIVSGVQRIKNGDLETKIPIRPFGELEDLAIAVNAMQMELKTTIAKEREEEHVKDELITNVAHDLRTPLTSILGYLNLLQNPEQLDKETEKKYLHIAYDKAVRMEGLVTDLFDFTRYEKNKMVITKSRLDLKQFMEQILDEFYPSLMEAHLECYTVFPPEKIYIDGDGELLARAFGNLMGNAIKYGAEGKQIQIEIQNYPETHRVRVSIINYGRLIAPKDLDKIFDKFYRGDTSRSSKEGGTGLGLAIAKNIFDMHNGMIRVRSDEGGTVFEVLLPTV